MSLLNNTQKNPLQSDYTSLNFKIKITYFKYLTGRGKSPMMAYRL